MRTEQDNPEQQPSKRNPYTPWFVVLTFTAPVLAAYLMYFFGDVKSFSNNGELLNPVVDFSQMEIKSTDGQAFTTDSLERRWHLIYFAGGSCDETCVSILTNLRQINIAVGKNANRLRRLIIHLDQPGSDFVDLIKQEFPDTITTMAARDTIALKMRDVNFDFKTNDVYLVDPLGNIMMRFPANLSPKLLMKDLNKLFKVSQIG